MMDSKEGIEKVAPVDAQAAGLLDPSFLRPGTHDATTADPPRERAGSPTGSCASLDEHPRWESNCLYVRVLRDSDAILEQDRKVPEYCWNAGISKDICEARTRVVPGTFSVDLLSDTKFLVYRVPKMTRGMSNREARCYADLIMGSYLWAVKRLFPPVKGLFVGVCVRLLRRMYLSMYWEFFTHLQLMRGWNR